METINRLAGAVLTIFSGIAFGVLAMTGVVAAVVFPMMKDLDPTLPGYHSYSGEHWSLAAGFIAERIFDIGFVVSGLSLSLSLAAVLTLSFTQRVGGRPIIRLALVLVTLGLFLTHVTWLQPRMDAAAGEYRAAAQRGNNEAAGDARARFDNLHPIASNLIVGATAGALCLFCAAVAGAVCRRRRSTNPSGETV